MKKLYIAFIIVLILPGCLNQTNPPTPKAYEPKEELYIKTEKDIYNTTDDIVNYIIYNESESPTFVLLIPTLEIKENNEWKSLNFIDGVGFCGNSDRIETELEYSFSLKWFENIIPGEYRVSYCEENEENECKLISTEFQIVEG